MYRILHNGDEAIIPHGKSLNDCLFLTMLEAQKYIEKWIGPGYYPLKLNEKSVFTDPWGRNHSIEIVKLDFGVIFE